MSSSRAWRTGRRHPATHPQLLAVIDGQAWVSGADGEPRAVTVGEAAFWDAGEEHDTPGRIPG